MIAHVLGLGMWAPFEFQEITPVVATVALGGSPEGTQPLGQTWIQVAATPLDI